MGFFRLALASAFLRFLEISIPDDIHGWIGLTNLLGVIVLKGKKALNSVSNVERKLFVASWVQLISVTWFQLKFDNESLNFFIFVCEKFLDSKVNFFSFVLLKLIWWITGKWSERREQSINESWQFTVELVKIWSIKVAEFPLTLVGLVTSCRKPYEKIVSTYSAMNLLERSKMFKLKSP